MNVLLTYKRDDVVYMATTSFHVYEDRAYTVPCETNYTIKKLNNAVLISVPDNMKLRHTVFAYPEIFDLDRQGKLTKKHVVTNIVPKLKQIIDRHGLINKEEDSLPYMDTCVVIAYKGEMFEINEWFQVIKYENYQTFGARERVMGLYTLANIKDTDDAEEKLIRALDIIVGSTQINNDTPYILIDTKDLEFRITGGNAV